MAALTFCPDNNDDQAHPKKHGEPKVEDAHQAEAAHESDGHAHEGDGHAHDGHAHHDMSTFEGRKAVFFDPGHLVAHVQDQDYFDYPSGNGAKHGKLYIPHISL